jgi:hypothetical protein
MAKMTNVTNKTYVRKLEDQLMSEKAARKKLESEVEEMRRVNQEISSRLGLMS